MQWGSSLIRALGLSIASVRTASREPPETAQRQRPRALHIAFEATHSSECLLPVFRRRCRSQRGESVANVSEVRPRCPVRARNQGARAKRRPAPATPRRRRPDVGRPFCLINHTRSIASHRVIHRGLTPPPGPEAVFRHEGMARALGTSEPRASTSLHPPRRTLAAREARRRNQCGRLGHA